MNGNEGTVTATAYIQIAADRGYWTDPTTGEKRIVGARALKLTQERARKPIPDTVTVKVAIEIPKSAFLPLMPEVTVIIPEEMASPPVRVVAHSPGEEVDA